MARLPIVNGDNGNWGVVLNDFLGVAHKTDGSLKNQWLNVKDFGAIGDGVTDDTTAIQSSLNALPSGFGTLGDVNSLYFPRGTYLISDTLNFKNRFSQKFFGDSATIQARHGTDFSGKVMANFSGSAYTIIDGIRFVSTLSSNKPSAVLVYGRNSGLMGSNMQFNNCYVLGDCTVATFLWAQADCSSMKDCSINSGGSAPAFFMTTNNDSGLLDYAGTTNTLNMFQNCYFSTISNDCSKLIVMQGLLQDIKFDTCFFTTTKSDSVDISIEDSPSAGASNQILNLRFINCDAESSMTANGLFMKIANSYGVFDLTLDGFNWGNNTNYIISIDSQIATYGLWNSFIRSYIKSYNDTKLIHLISGALQNCIIECSTSELNIETGTTCQYNVVRCSGVMPFYGSPGIYSNNIIIERDGSFGIGRLGYQTYNIPDLATTAGANTGIVIFSNTSPTTFTTLTGNITGQVVHCLFTNGNTTIAHTHGYIKLAGSLDWNAPANSTLTLLSTSADHWIELSRSIP
jgi:hypothetical protein